MLSDSAISNRFNFLFWFSLTKILFRSSRNNAFFFLILWAVTHFAASNVLVTKKNDCKGRHLPMTYGKTLRRKTMCLYVENVWPARIFDNRNSATCIGSAGRKQTWCAVAHSFQVIKYYWYFLIVFSSRHCLYIRGRFCIKCWNVFWWRSCATDTVLRSLKWKMLLRINKSWVQNFPRCESNFNDQNTKEDSIFYPRKVATPYFSETEIVVWCLTLTVM